MGSAVWLLTDLSSSWMVASVIFPERNTVASPADSAVCQLRMDVVSSALIISASTAYCMGAGITKQGGMHGAVGHKVCVLQAYSAASAIVFLETTAVLLAAWRRPATSAHWGA